MTIEDQIKDEKLQYDINRKLQKYQFYHQASKLIIMKILQVRKYYLTIKNNYRTS